MALVFQDSSYFSQEEERNGWFLWQPSFGDWLNHGDQKHCRFVSSPQHF